MSHRSLIRLKSLNLSFCDWGGSSKGVREFLNKDQFYELFDKPENNSINFNFNIQRNKHPTVYVEYHSGYKKYISLRNLTLDNVYDVLKKLPEESGKKPYKHNGHKVLSYNKSIQGKWQQGMFPFIQNHTMQHFIDIPQDDYSDETLKKHGVLQKYHNEEHMQHVTQQFKYKNHKKYAVNSNL